MVILQNARFQCVVQKYSNTLECKLSLKDDYFIFPDRSEYNYLSTYSSTPKSSLPFIKPITGQSNEVLFRDE